MKCVACETCLELDKGIFSCFDKFLVVVSELSIYGQYATVVMRNKQPGYNNALITMNRQTQRDNGRNKDIKYLWEEFIHNSRSFNLNIFGQTQPSEKSAVGTRRSNVEVPFYRWKFYFPR